MDLNKTDLFLMLKGNNFESHQLPGIKNELEVLDDERWKKLLMTDFNDPKFFQIISFLGGTFGIDRFLVGDTGLGVAKLLTCGGMGIWTIIDWFLIGGVAREKNVLKLKEILSGY
ncbi:TM2 domain-containing protein [Ravibacter arvi]|uniref:TM2 domain-containing protein n=1 Tax=Ravibacter arvi TaxID=2051041 RepID=A0ABP8M3L7_9BACT